MCTVKAAIERSASAIERAAPHVRREKPFGEGSASDVGSSHSCSHVRCRASTTQLLMSSPQPASAAVGLAISSAFSTVQLRLAGGSVAVRAAAVRAAVRVAVRAVCGGVGGGVGGGVVVEAT